MNPQPSDRPLSELTLPDLSGSVDDWLRTARTTREAGRTTDARAILEEAAQRFPRSAAVMHDLARIAEAVRDWSAAEQRWRNFLALADMWWAFTSLANALREQGRLQDADTVLIEQFVRLSHEPWIFFEYALLAERTRNWTEAAKRWTDATTRFPQRWEGFSGQSRALRQLGDIRAARHLLTTAADGFPNLAQPFHDIARLAEADQDWCAAEQAWRDYLGIDQKEWWAHVGLAQALRHQRRFDEADAVLANQFTRFAGEPGIFFEHAAIAEERGDWAEAAERYRTLVDRYPDRPHAALGLVYMLARLGRRAEGDDILRQAIIAHPHELALQLAFARNAAEIGPEGATAFLQRAKQTRLDLPHEPEAHGFLADAFAANGLFDQAEDCLAPACMQFPENADLLKRRATNLAQQSKWDEALSIFDTLDRLRPSNEQTEYERVKLLMTAGRWDAAEVRLTATLGRFPGSEKLLAARLDVAIGRGRLDLAIAQWREIERERPSDPAGLLFERRLRLLGLGNDPVEAPRAADEKQHLALKFESLGGNGLGCEFGLVQRAMGAEPLGLLRWADIDTDGLIEALETAFEGVGEPGQTELEIVGGALDEYVSKDRRYGFRLHTYVPSGQVTPDRMLTQTCRRLSFLKQKLLDDLHRADKILVYKNARQPLSDPELDRLRLAIRAYGANTLLYVRYQDETHRFLSVTAPAPGLLIGHIDTMGLTADGMPTPIPFNSWMTLASNAYALWKVAT